MSETLFDLANRYIDRLNAEILPRIDYIRLQESYDTCDQAYAMAILHLLHNTAVEVYGKDLFSHDDLKQGPLVLPGVLVTPNPFTLCLALFTVGDCPDILMETDLFTKYGLILGSQKQPAEIQKFVDENYTRKDYALTATTSFCHGHYPYEVRRMIEGFRTYRLPALLSGPSRVVEPEEESDEESR